MKFYLLLILGQVMTGVAHFSHKLFSRKSNSFIPTGTLYSALISLFSLPIFAILAKGALAFDADMAFYSIAYGVLAALSQVMIFIAFSRVNMVVYSVFNKSSSILVCLAGYFIFGDDVTVTSVLSILLLTVAIILPLFEMKRNEGGKSSFVGLLICVIMMLNGFIINLVVKGFTELPTTTVDRASGLYFYANAVTALALFILLAVITRKKRAGVGAQSETGGLSPYRIGIPAVAKKVPPLFYLIIPFTATIANIPCVTNALCMMNLNLSAYMVVLNAAESLVMFCISRFIFKEKSTKIDIFSLALSTLAGIVTAL